MEYENNNLQDSFQPYSSVIFMKWKLLQFYKHASEVT